MPTPPYDPNDIFKDFNSSGAVHEPAKQQIRILLSWVVGLLNGASVTKTTLALLNADLAHDQGTAGYVYADGSNNGTYVKIGASGTGSWELMISQALQTSVTALQAIVTALTAEVRDADITLASAATGGVSPYVARVSNATFRLSSGLADFVAGFEAGADIAVGAIFDCVVVDLAMPAGTAGVQSKVWSRSTADAAVDTAVPGTVGVDTQVGDTLLTTPAAAGMAAALTYYERVVIPVARTTVASGRTYLIELDAVLPNGTRQALGIGYFNVATGFPVHRRGWYRPTTASAFSAVSATVLFSVAPALRNLRRAEDEIADQTATDVDVEDVIGSMTRSIVSVAERTQTASYDVTTGFAGVGGGLEAGTDIPVGELVSFTTRIKIGADAAFVRFGFMIRPLATSTSLPPGQPADLLYVLDTKTVAEAGLVAGIESDVVWEFPKTVTIAAGRTYYWFTECLATDGTLVAFGWARGATLADGHRRGFYRPNTVSPWFTIAAGASASWWVRRNRYSLAGSGGDATPIGETVVQAAAPTSPQDYSVDIPSLTIKRPSGDLLVSAGTVTIDAPASTAVPSEALTITYLAGGVAVPPETGYLDWQYVDSLIVTRDSDSATLTAGVDYAAKTGMGVIYGIPNIAAYAAHAAYVGHAHRYDIIHADAVTGALGVTKGTDRAQDPENYQPTLPAGKIELYRAYVTKDGVELISSCRFDGLMPIANRSEVMADRERNRRAIRKSLGRAAAGLTLKVGLYGDSITALRGAEGGANQLVPNVDRDRNQGGTTGYWDRMPADTLATLVSQGLAGLNADAAAAPGQSATYNGQFVRLGWGWRFRQAIIDRFGSAVEIYNMGIGGTTSAATMAGSLYNGSHPDRLAAMNSLACHLVIVNFGTNDADAASLEANLAVIGASLQGAGAELIFIPPPQINSFGAHSTQAGWLAKHDAVGRAAHRLGAAFVNLYGFEGAGMEGGIKMSRAQMSSMNLYNHPGVAEHAAIGQALAALAD